MKTYYTPVDEIARKWYVVDADGKVLGRIATEIASRLRGKHKPTFCNFQDNGDFIVVVNAEKVALTGKKEEQNQYMFYSGFVGNEKYRSLKDMRARKPEFIIQHAVKGMLPKNRLAHKMMTKLKIYAGDKHPHESQNPETVAL